MRILLDECIDESLRYHFAGHECKTCRFAGFKGLANGKLLAAAEQAGSDVLITSTRIFRISRMSQIACCRSLYFEVAAQTSTISSFSCGRSSRPSVPWNRVRFSASTGSRRLRVEFDA